MHCICRRIFLPVWECGRKILIPIWRPSLASRNATATHMGDEGHQYHAMEFLIYAYLQSGRDIEARQLIEEVRSLPKMKDMYGTGF